MPFDINYCWCVLWRPQRIRSVSRNVFKDIVRIHRVAKHSSKFKKIFQFRKNRKPTPKYAGWISFINDYWVWIWVLPKETNSIIYSVWIYTQEMQDHFLLLKTRNAIRERKLSWSAPIFIFSFMKIKFWATLSTVLIAHLPWRRLWNKNTVLNHTESLLISITTI